MVEQAAPVKHAPQKSWADDDDEFEPTRPTELRPVTYPATSSTSTSTSSAQAPGSAGARGDFSSFAPKDRREGGGYRGRGDDRRDDRGYGRDRGGYEGRDGGRYGGREGGREGGRDGDLAYNSRGDFRDAPRDRDAPRRSNRGGRGGSRRGGGFDRRHEPVEFIDSAYEVVQVEEWDKFGFKEPILRGIYSKGFERPSLCQTQGIKPLLDGKNLLLQAQSGHGKTAVFGTAILNRIDTGAPDRESIQAVVLVPNRDLARQVRVRGLCECWGSEECMW